VCVCVLSDKLEVSGQLDGECLYLACHVCTRAQTDREIKNIMPLAANTNEVEAAQAPAGGQAAWPL